MSPEKKAWLSKMRPQFLAMIDECDENIKLMKAIRNEARNDKRIIHDPADVPFYKSIKAFFICICNGNKIEATKWFDKVKEHGLAKMEAFESFEGDAFTGMSMNNGKVSHSTGQDNSYMFFCKNLKERTDEMEQCLTFL